MGFTMQHHSCDDVLTIATIQICWDSDRFDFGRVGIKPSKQYISEETHGFIDLA
jgi:uncharacterized protein